MPLSSSNTVSVIDPSTNRTLGVIRLGDPQPTNLSPLYRGQVLVHGLGFSPDRKTLAVVSIASNSVTFIDTASNKIKQIEPIARFTTNPAGSQIVIAVGPIRQIVDPALGGSDERRYLTVMTVENGATARPVQIQQCIDPQQ